MPYFVVWIYLDLKCEFVRKKYGFTINSKTSCMSSGDKPFLTLRFQSQVFANLCDEYSKSYPLIVIPEMTN